MRDISGVKRPDLSSVNDQGDLIQIENIDQNKGNAYSQQSGVPRMTDERGDMGQESSESDAESSFGEDQEQGTNQGGQIVEPEQVQIEMNVKDKSASSFGLLNEQDVASEDKNASLHMPRDGAYDAHPSYASRNSNENYGPNVDQKDSTQLKEQPVSPSAGFEDESFNQVEL